jgi:hypothetical protein
VAHSERLASRVREILAEGGQVAERRMFGGLAFMVNGHMCCGIIRDDLMLRLGADQAGQALKEPHVRPMDFTGRPLRGVRVRRSARVEDRGQASPLARAGPPVHRHAAAEVAELPPAGSSHRVTRRPCATSTGCGSRSTQPSGVPPTPPTRSRLVAARGPRPEAAHTFYKQSDQPARLTWSLNCVTPKRLMTRAHADKAVVADAEAQGVRTWTPTSTWGCPPPRS